MMDRENIRILRIIARLNIGGPAIQALSLTHAFSFGPYETFLVCGNVGPHEGDMSYLAEQKGVKPYLIPELGREISPFTDLKALRGLREIIKTFRPHIIHTHTAKAGTLGRLAGGSFNLLKGNRQKIKLVHTFHGHVFHRYFGSMKTVFFICIERLLGRFTDRIIVISPLQKRDICERFQIVRSGKVRVIPLGFDLSDFLLPKGDRNNIRKKFFPDVSNEILVVGIVGRLTPIKNHRMFLDAVRWLKDKGKSDCFRFLIIGDGELREELIQYSHSLGVEDLVFFGGWQRDMPSLYRAMDISVLTSLNEGTPVTLIEAMAAGRPVIATEVGGVCDLMGEVDSKNYQGYKLAQNGILIPSGKAENLGKALLFLTGNRHISKNISENGRRAALARFSMERLVRDMELLYLELVNPIP